MKSKVAKLDLNKVKENLEARFNVSDIDDNLIELENKFSGPKFIYVNDKGEVWTSDADIIEKANSVPEAHKIFRRIVSAKYKGCVLKVSDLIKMLAPTDAIIDHPILIEQPIIDNGSEITIDILNEPEIAKLNLTQEDQNQVAIMVFDSILNSKNTELEKCDSLLAPKISSYLNRYFENLKFGYISDDLIRVFFDSKFASSKVSEKEIISFISSCKIDVGFYNDLVIDFSNKISQSLPDYFQIRQAVLDEVMEQKNEQK